MVWKERLWKAMFLEKTDEAGVDQHKVGNWTLMTTLGMNMYEAQELAINQESSKQVVMRALFYKGPATRFPFKWLQSSCQAKKFADITFITLALIKVQWKDLILHQFPCFIHVHDKAVCNVLRLPSRWLSPSLNSCS